MSVVNNNLLLTADAGVAPSAYQIQRSLRFNSADSAYLSRTPSVAGNRQTWTWAGWVKCVNISGEGGWFLSATNGGSSTEWFRFYNGKLNYLLFTGGTFLSNLEPAAVYRYTSAWYHIVLAIDTTQATASDRVKFYVNGVQLTSVAGTYPPQNTNTYFNSTALNLINKESRALRYANYYLADVHFIDGQALTPSSFTETNATTGQLVPKAFSVSYGVNGFRLNFSDNSAATAATLGADSSGNGNNWTPNNLSAANSFLGGNNGTLVNGPTYSSANGGSIVFDVSNDYVSVSSISVSTFTYQGWVYNTPSGSAGDF